MKSIIKIQCMSFFDYYFSRYSDTPTFFSDIPEDSLGMIVVIPCYNDSFIFHTLSSLEKTNESECSIEVIVIVNSGENTSQEIIEKNREIFAELNRRSTNKHYNRFKLQTILVEDIPKKHAGVGNARKTGMDEAIRRFRSINKPKGILISLDADCLVCKDYFRIIEKAFKKNPQNEGFVFQYQHNFDTTFYSVEEINACRLYEIYLRYYKLALAISGFPYSFQTIGSCFAVTAEAYIKVGGMSRRQGGEDFYFLHKLAQTTKIEEISEILVFPSPRISERVPFGTGPTVKNIIDSGMYRVYNFELFLILKHFFQYFDVFSTARENIELNDIPKEIINFVGNENLLKTMEECKQNTKQKNNLKKRLFSKFDAFFIVKFLNTFDKNSLYPPMDIQTAVNSLFDYYSQHPQIELTLAQKKDIELITDSLNNI